MKKSIRSLSPSSPDTDPGWGGGNGCDMIPTKGTLRDASLHSLACQVIRNECEKLSQLRTPRRGSRGHAALPEDESSIPSTHKVT